MADVITKASVVTADSPVIDLRSKITLIAPDNAKHHAAGEEIRVSPTQKAKFLKKGFYEPGNKPAAKESKESKPPEDPKK